MKRWNQVLTEWETGNYPKIPNNIKKPFFWRTSVVKKNKDSIYKEEFLENDELSAVKRQDLKTFSEHFQKKKNVNEKYAIAFPNLSGDTTLVVPIPRNGKQFTNLYKFMNNASEIHKVEFWKKVAKEIRKMQAKFENIWISVHGLGVNYLHVRICSKPKYYNSCKLKRK